MFGFRRVLLVGLVSLNSICTLASAPAWTEVRSAHFLVITDAGERRARQVAMRFEQMRAVFAQLILKDRLKSIPLHIIAFRNGREMRDYCPLYKGKPVELSGFYQSASDANYVAVDMAAEYHWEAVFHEYAHTLLSTSYQATQVWFDEGFAEYYSSIRVGENDVLIGNAPEGYGSLLATAQLMPIVQLFKVEHDSPLYNESGDRRSSFYVQSWLTYHYFHDTQQLPQLSKYFKLVNSQHQPVETAIQQAFGIAPGALDTNFHNYLSGRRMLLLKVKFPSSVDTASFTAWDLSETDARAELADLHLHSKDYFEKAIIELTAIEKAAPGNAIAHRGLAYAYLKKGDLGEASREFRQAAAAGSQDAMVHYHSAIIDESGAMLRGDKPADPEYSRKELEAAIALDAECAECFAALGMLDHFAGDYEAAVKHYRSAHFLSPDDERYRLGLAQALMMLRRWDESERLLVLLKDSNDPNVTSRASRVLEYVQRMKGREEDVATHIQVVTEQAGDGPPAHFAHSDGDAPAETREPATEAPAVVARPKMKFVKGVLTYLDCSHLPAISIRLRSQGKTLLLRAAHKSSVALVGADGLACGRNTLHVAVNYEPDGETGGELVSVEIQ